jgi:hypothetical protein
MRGLPTLRGRGRGQPGGGAPLHLICLACGDELAPALAEAGSLRCHGCRVLRAPLQAPLARLQRARYEAAILGDAA